MKIRPRDRKRLVTPYSLTISGCVLALLVAGCPPSADEPGGASLEAAANDAEQAIAGELLRRHVAELADDRLEGRGPGSAGDRLAQRYLADQLRELGLEAGGLDGGFLQPFEIVGITAEAPASWTFEGQGGELTVDWWQDAIAFSGVQRERAAIVDAELVFVGYGIQAPEYDWDDYGDADLAGAVLVMMNNDPEWDPELFEGERRLYYGRWDYKYAKAAEMGAVGAIIIHTTPSAGYPFQVVQTSWTGEQFELPAGDEARLEVGAWLTEAAARELFAFAGHDLDALRERARGRDFAPQPLGLVTSFSLTNRVRRVETANVIGLLPGSDPELGDEVVVYTAHHDHLGIGTPNDDGDAVYNGALDNAAGVAQVLAIARAFSELPRSPRRSILFNFVAAEEQGLLGSEHYAREPTFHPGRMAAVINYDGGNIWGRTTDVTYIGYGKSTLDAVVETYAGQQGRSVRGDQFPDRGFFYRSDQFNFAKIGVPAIYIDNGTDFIGRPPGWGKEQIEAWEAVHYHQPTDELTAAWKFDGMVEDARLGFRSGLWIAEQDELPAWRPGDEFEAARLEALAAVAAD